MEATIRTLLRELEQFGAANDAASERRDEKMLNITPDTGEFLAILVQLAGARRILEIGTSNGYSTIWLAEAVRAIGGTVVTVEHSPPKVLLAQENFARAGLADAIAQQVIEGGEFLGRPSVGPFDLVFLDSDRRQYVAWWANIQNVLAPGGVLVMDNAVSHAAEVAEFVATVRATPGWRSAVLPVGNGELIALKPSA